MILNKNILIDKVKTFAVMFWVVLHTYAETPPMYHFQQFSIKEGLTQTTVRTILRDSEGFLWIGTAFGLNRFDGQNLTQFFASPDKKNGLLGNLIFFVAEDAEKNIWVSANGGLTLFNKNTQQFEIQKIKNAPFESYAYLLVSDGLICCTSGQLYKYVYATKKWKILPMKSEKHLPFQFTDILSWDTEHLLLSSRYNGIYLYSLSTGAIQEVAFYKSKKNVMDIFLDAQRNLWIAPYGEGLMRYSQTGKHITTYNTQNSPLSHDVVLDIIERNGKLWIATDGGGINIFNLRDNSFSHIAHTPENQMSFPANSIQTLYEDKQGCLWVGSIRNGLIEIIPAFMKTYTQTSLQNPYGLTNESIISLFEDKSGSVWIGTDGGGVNKLTPQTGLFMHFSGTINDKVTSITNYDEKHLLISIFNKGLFFFDTHTGEKKQLTVINKEENARILESGYAATLHRKKEDIQILSDNIYLYDIQSSSFSTIEFKNEKGNPRNILKKVASDPENRYLFNENKIYHLDKGNTYHTLLKLPESEVINAAALDSKGVLWIGSDKGLKRFHPEIDSVANILMPFKTTITSLVCDNQNRVWIGTRDGLLEYHTEEAHFEIFSESNGASANEYFQQSILISQSGNVYMGGVNGLLFINKHVNTKKEIVPKIRLTEVIKNQKEREVLYINKGEDVPPKINLPWDKSSITLRVIAQEKDIFRKRTFRYYILGLSDEPIETIDQSLTLQPLSSGKYTIAVSCNLADGTWSPRKNILRIKILPPWWKSKWFIALLILFILFAIVWSIVLFIRKKENTLKWQLKEREKKMYEEKVRFLINISHELRTPLTLIYAPLKRMLHHLPEKESLRIGLENIYKQAAHMKQIINMVLDIRKMETGNEKLHIAAHPLHQWIEETTDYFSEETAYRKIDIQFAFDERIGEIAFDKDKCRIVLSNLLSNALKFGASETTIVIATELHEADNCVRISVSDEGIGLDGVDVNQLFSRFYQAKHERGGSGIGLSFSKKLVTMHGGTMGAKNNQDSAGATFFFELPLHQQQHDVSLQAYPYTNELLSSENNLLTEADYTLSTKIDTTTYSLLAVEDNAELLAFLKQHFRDKFKTVYTAMNGNEALEIVRRELPDIIVSDVVMPKMDGFSLCRQIKSDIDISHIPIVLLTARGDADNKRLGYKLGADAYLSKPFDIDFLQTILENQLNVRARIKARYKPLIPLPSPQEITFSNADEKFISKLNAVIETRLTEPNLNVAFICSEMGMSRASLYNKIKDLLNIGVNDYINRIKLEKAATLLLSHPEKSIAEIASMTGFSTQRYFSSRFKEFKGMSPSVYRKKKKLDEKERV